MSAEQEKQEIMDPTDKGSGDLQIVEGPAATPMHLLQMATQQGANPETLERYMGMQERYEANEARKAYVLAMTQFRGECPIIDKTRTGHNSKYAGLAETINQVQGLLSKCGLSHSWKTNQAGPGIEVTCCVTHALGHQECTSMNAPADDSGKKNTIQAIASTVTYLERYTLFAVLGLASSDQDLDGDEPENTDTLSLDEETIINDLLDETGVDKALFLEWAKAEKVEDILATNFDKVHKELLSKQAKK
ncbi:MAG: ERF family protein [Rhodospirillaceae bacterium]|nr:ERF family protein [Rhodospirillaceae bacterium]